MKHDILVVMDHKAELLDEMIKDLESINLTIKEDESNEDWIVYHYELDDDELNSLLEFVAASPYGEEYEIECWDGGNCKYLWNNFS